jgi:RNA 3'-terminal phosphate cyclase
MRTNEDKYAQKRLELVCGGLVYDPRELSGVTTIRIGVAGVLQMVLEPTLVVSRARTGQLRMKR